MLLNRYFAECGFSSSISWRVPSPVNRYSSARYRSIVVNSVMQCTYSLIVSVGRALEAVLVGAYRVVSGLSGSWGYPIGGLQLG